MENRNPSLNAFAIVDEFLGPWYEPCSSEERREIASKKNLEGLTINIFTFEKNPEIRDVKYNLIEFYQFEKEGRQEEEISQVQERNNYKNLNREIENAKRDIERIESQYNTLIENIQKSNNMNINYVDMAKKIVEPQKIILEERGTARLKQEQVEMINRKLIDFYKSYGLKE